MSQEMEVQMAGKDWEPVTPICPTSSLYVYVPICKHITSQDLSYQEPCMC